MKTKVYTKYLLGAIIIFLLQIQTTTFAQTIESKLDSLLGAKYIPSEPGAVFLIAKDGKAIYKKAFGMANIELDVPLKTEHIFEIGSMTKQFTAVSILMLLEQGKLELSDEITKYIPDYPTQGKTITIHHLLNHTSGIKSYTSIKGLMGIAKKDLSPLELIDFFKNEPMDFSPGEKYKYNNSGYILLGYIIESVSDMSYGEFVEENIFKKLNMSSSFYASHRKVFKNRVSGYHNRDGFTNAMHISFTLPYAAGSLLSNVDDMLTWQNALRDYKLVSKTILDKAFTNYTLTNNEATNYGYGWNIKEINDIKSLEHGGSIFGFKSMGVYLPDEDIYVIGLNNCDCNSPTKITREIASLFLEEMDSMANNEN